MTVTHTRGLKIYCAGPLFNNKEKDEMAEIATALEQHGFKTFLPHRDGLEFANLLSVLSKMFTSETEAKRLLHKAIFTLDVYQVLNSNGLILNINGRVPDEGATVEAGIAWHAGKQVVIYKNDARTLINGTDNPLLLGLSDFVLIDNISKIPVVFQELFDKSKTNRETVINNSRIQEFYQKGKIVAELTQNGYDKAMICRKLIDV